MSTEKQPNAHTPTPWHVGRVIPTMIYCTEHPTRTAIAEVLQNDWNKNNPWISRETQVANAALIVAAVNAHAALTAENKQLRSALKRCEKVVAWVSESGSENAQVTAALNKARALLQGGAR